MRDWKAGKKEVEKMGRWKKRRWGDEKVGKKQE